MVCPFCDNETKVINSRRQRRNNQVWRRRQCLACGTVFTTHEAIELGSVLFVEINGRLKPFLPDLLLKDIMLALQDSPNAPEAAREVLATVVKKLLKLPQKPVFLTADISKAVSVVLERFDKRAHLRYLAEHTSLQ